MWRKGNTWYTAGGNAKWCSNYNMEFSQKIRNRATIWSSNHSSGYISKGNGIRISKGYLHFHIHFGIIHNNQDTETTWLSIDEQTDKENVVCVSVCVCVCVCIVIGIPHFILLHFINLHRYCVYFLKEIEGVWEPKQISAIFPQYLLILCLCVTFW